MNEASQILLARIRESGSVLLTGPEGPDGDSLGACLALQRLAAVAAPGVRVDVAGVPAQRYRWMPGASAIVPDAEVGAYDGVVVLDGDRSRLPVPVAAAFRGATWTGLIDHHRSTDASLYAVALFSPTAESTCGMIARLAANWGVAIDTDTAALLYAGMLFDTGGFRYSNTTADTLRLAADLVATGIDHAQIALRVLMERRPASLRLMARILSEARFLEDGRLAVSACPRAWFEAFGANDGDLEGVVDHLQHVTGVEVAVLAVERGPEKVKLSLRSAGAVDVAATARALSPNGGGHAKAAGVALGCSLDEAVARVEREVGARVRGVD